MDLEILAKAIEKRKGRGIKFPEEKKKPDEDGLIEGKENPEEKDGLAPDIKVKPEETIDQHDREEIERIKNKEAEEVLGRKPMSLTQKNQDDDDEFSLNAGDLDPEVMENLKDDELIERLQSGKKPGSLWERMQMSLAKAKKS